MKYMILIYSDESGDANATPQDLEQMMTAYNAYTDDLAKSGVMVDGDALHPTSAATTVRVRDGKRLTTHGPFAETHEQLGGYYILDCKNLDEAIEWAARCPGAQRGSIEVRPVMVFEGEGVQNPEAEAHS